jgi:sec-independent protein translocase protein TatB
VFENVGYGEILVLLVAGLFILGPERLPEAAAWLARTLKQVKDFATGARNQLKEELGPDFEELRKPIEELREPLDQLRGLRRQDPRRMVRNALFEDGPDYKPNGYTPPRNGGEVPRMHPAAEPSRPLAAGERPPIDPDAT